MDNNNLFFIYLGKLIGKKENSNRKIDQRIDLKTDSNILINQENEWFQEYEVIYKSYALERY
jgi:hypothetical protein